MRRSSIIVALVATTLALAVSEPTEAATGGMSKSQITTMELSINKALSQAAARPTSSVSCNSSGTSCLLSFRYDATRRCSAGGSIHVLGTLSGTASRTSLNPGSVWLHGNITVSILNWRCIGGWVVNGDPYVSYALRIDTHSIFSALTLSQSGGWLATTPKGVKPAQKQSCQTHGSVSYGSFLGGRATQHVRCVPGGAYDITQKF